MGPVNLARVLATGYTRTVPGQGRGVAQGTGRWFVRVVGRFGGKSWGEGRLG